MLKKLFISILWIWTLFAWVSLAAEQASFSIIPEPETSESASNIVNDVAKSWGHVRENYRKNAQWRSLGTQLASGVMTWDTILDYAVYLMKFLWQLALLAWAIMIIYLWYEKAIKPLFGSAWKLWHIILWILVVTFAYVIIKIIWNMFIS